jgi:sialic acid synthase SpsE
MASRLPVSWPRFVLDLANNHQGSIERGSEIIHAHARVFKDRGHKVAIKFQLRDLERYTHGDEAYREKFKAAQLLPSDYATLARVARDNGFLVAATPFDPASVELVTKLGCDYIKIASCSVTDHETVWAAQNTKLPAIVSTGGGLATDWMRFGFSDIAVMHCVSLYPCPAERCDLATIARLKNKFPHRPIGWSTHEDPNNTEIIQIAATYGAEIFERHIGLGGENAYTSSPRQIEAWVDAYERAVAIAGQEDRLDRSDERAALARVERKNTGATPIGGDSDRAALEGGTFAPPWAYGVFADGVLSDNLHRPGVLQEVDRDDAGPIASGALAQRKGRNFRSVGW